VWLCRDTQKTQHGIETATRRVGYAVGRWVETLRKPSTGLKQCVSTVGLWSVLVETLRKPSTGLKLGQSFDSFLLSVVETLRKPSTGLKHRYLLVFDVEDGRRDTQKTQHGIETGRPAAGEHRRSGRDTQKTQHGIETRMPDVWCVIKRKSRHSENPARD